MADKAVSFMADTGKTTYRLFPSQENGVSLSTWGSNAKVATEAAAPDLGKYTATVDDTYRYWTLFDGASQPASWGEWVAVIDIHDGVIRSEDLDTSALAAINKHRKA